MRENRKTVIPQGARDENGVSRAGIATADRDAIKRFADAGRRNVYPVPFAALDDFGVARDDENAGFLCSPSSKIKDAVR